ncbi:beta-caryophyllene synthase [Tanacetum coccineum]
MSESHGTLNDDTPRIDVAEEVVSPSVVDDTVEKEKLNPVVTTTESYPPLPMQVTTSAGNAHGKSSYANVSGKLSRKKLIFHTLFTPQGNGIDVVVPVESIRTISERFANTTYGVFLGKRVAYPVVANYVKNTWGKYRLVRSMFSSSTGLFSIDGLDAMLENSPWFIRNNPLIMRKWHPDENLSKEDVSTVPVWVNHHGVPFTAFSEDGLSAIATKLGHAMLGALWIELRVDLELEDNIVACLPKIIWGDYYIYSESTKEVSRSNPFEVLTSADNDVELGTNEGISNSADKGTFNVSSSNTPIVDKFDKIERQIREGKLRFVDDDGNSLVPTGIVDSDSDSEVEVVFDETANLRLSKNGKDRSDKGYGTNSLLEQWRDLYPDNDDYDPYDDDMYKNHDMSENLQSICNDLDITVRDMKKK